MGTTNELGLRERKKQATRQALGLAALRLAVSRGLDNVLIDDIAAEVGVSTRTFSNYFATKYEAICGLAVDRAARIGAELRARPGNEPLWTALTNAVLAHHQLTEPPDRTWTEGIKLITSTPAVRGEYLKTRAVMQQALAAAIAERTGTDPATDLFPEVLAGAVGAATEIALDRWLAADPPTELTTEVRAAMRELAASLRKALPETEESA